MVRDGILLYFIFNMQQILHLLKVTLRFGILFLNLKIARDLDTWFKGTCEKEQRTLSRDTTVELRKTAA